MCFCQVAAGVPLDWVNIQDNFSITCLVPSLLAWLNKLEADQASLSLCVLFTWPVWLSTEPGSLSFLTRRSNFLVTGFYKVNILTGPGRSRKAPCGLTCKPQKVSHYHCIPCILLAKVTKVTQDLWGRK